MRTISPGPGRTVFCLLVSMVIGTTSAFARQTTITGSAGTVVDYRERSYKHDNSAYSDNGDRQKIGIQPEILIVSQDVRDSLRLRYSPTLSRDILFGENEVDHQLNLDAERWLSQFWSVSVTETYIRSDDPETLTRNRTTDTTDNRLSRDLSGRTYWTNTVNARTDYAFDQFSRLSSGYSYSVLRNDENTDGYEDHDRHALFADLAYGFSPNWRTNLGVDYSRGLYDRKQSPGTNTIATPDLDQYGFRFGVEYFRTPTDSYLFNYSFNQTLYDGDTRLDNKFHAWSLGWNHAFDSRTRVTLGAGPAYAVIQGQDGSWGYNAYATLMRTYEHATLALDLSKTYQTNNFTGNAADSGLTDTYSARGTFSYRHTQHLAFNVYGGFRSESNLDPQGAYRTSAGSTRTKTGDVSYDKNIYEAGIGCTYTFARWYTAGLTYGYYVSDGNLNNDQYTDHQILFTLRAQHNLWRW
jgi:hypothetical protein